MFSLPAEAGSFHAQFSMKLTNKVILVIFFLLLLLIIFIFKLTKNNTFTSESSVNHPVTFAKSDVSPLETSSRDNNQKTESAASPSTELKNNKIAFTEKDPFKAEFLKNFTKQENNGKLNANDFTKKLDASLPILNERTFIIPPQVTTTVAPTNSTVEPKKQKPQITVKGVYKYKNKVIAITERGEITVGTKIDGFIIKHIDIKGNIEFEDDDQTTSP